MFSGGGASPFGTQGDPWDQATKVAIAIASEGGAEPNVDPKDRMAIEDLSRVAALHARERPGVSLSDAVSISPVSRRTWTTDAIAAYRPFFERFSESISENGSAELEFGDDLSPEESAMLAPMRQMFGQMMNQMAPAMVITSAGAMLGHLGQRVVGTYDLPVPRPGSVVQVVPDGMKEIASLTGAPIAEVQMYVMIHELIAHSVLSIPHVAERLDSLFLDFASAFRPNPNALMGEIGDIGAITDLSQIAEISAKMGDTDAVLNSMRTGAHDLLMPQLDALVAAVLGFVENATMAACGRLMTGHPAIRDAMRARRIDASDPENFMEKLLGLNVNTATLERGEGFIAGIIERAGDAGLERLWADELDLPTPAEVDAPGLWLARIGIDGESGDSTTFEIPDDLSGLED